MNDSIYELISDKADAMLEKLRRTRRDLHAHPEMGWCEIRTSSIIADRLTALGYQVLTGSDVCLDEARMGLPDKEVLDAEYERAIAQGAIQPYAARARDGFTGVIGLLDCGEGPTIAMRFDIDALGVFEDESPEHLPAREGFRSENEGVMHACGHDGHVSIGLGVAELLMDIRDHLHGKIKLIFQPAEEGLRGARPIVEHGHLDDVDYVIGNHMGGNTEGYQIGLTHGSSLASTKMDVYYGGKAAHAGASPEKGDNALLAAATAVLNLQAIPRSGEGDTRINVGRLQAGSGRNVIPDRAKLEMEVRGSSTEVNRYMESYARRILEAAAAMHGCSCDIKLMGSAESLKSDPDMISYCERICTDKLGLKVTPPGSKSGGSEDYSFMVNRVHSHGGKGLFFMTLSPSKGTPHGKSFDFDEACMPNGVRAFCAMAYSLMNGDRP